MPLVHSEKIEEKVTIYLWQLVESETELKSLLSCKYNTEDLQTISHPQKIREWLASRLLIKTMVEASGLVYYGTHRDENGKVFLINHTHPISISHTHDYVAAVISEASPCGIDMEKMDPKLTRVANKFLSSGELESASDDIKKLCIYWCSKEALYKLHGRKKVSFREDIVISEVVASSKKVSGVLKEGPVIIKSPIHIRWVGDYCVAISV